MKVYLWISTTIVVVLVALTFIPTWNQYGFVPTDVLLVNGEILVSGSIGITTKNMYNRTIKMTRKASFMQCSLDETKGLEEAIHVSTHPDLYNHNHIVDIAASDHLKVTLSVATIKNRHRESTIATEHSIAQITCFDDYNQMLWETILDGSNETYYGPEIAIYNDLIYVTGYTRSPDFPVKNAFQETLVGDSNFFLSCFDLQGNMVWSTFINGTTDSLITSCVVSQNHIYITGWTLSADFPVKNAMQETLRGECNAFLSCFDLVGNLEWSTYLGGTGYSNAQSCTLEQDHIYITGYTRSPDFPVKNAFQETLNGQNDAFVSCFDLIGNLEWSTYLGGTINTRAQSCMFYQDHLYIAGWTSSPDFPVKNAMQDVFQTKRLNNDFIEDPMTNAFIVRLTPFGELETSTFMDYQGHSLRQYVDHPSCMLSAMDNGNVLVAIYQVAGSGESKMIQAWHDVQESNTLFYILTDDCKLISRHFMF